MLRGWLLAAVLVNGTGCAASPGTVDEAAQSVIDRSRNTEATYSLYSWNIISNPDGDGREEWSAEFHDGHAHRVETPRDRIVADCENMTGTHLNVLTGEITRSAAIARAACGIQANSRILSASVEGKVQTEFGQADALTIVDPDNVRTYLVDDNGILIGSTIQSPEGVVLLKVFATGVQNSVPQGIFSEDSLQMSAVPAEFRTPPE